MIRYGFALFLVGLILSAVFWGGLVKRDQAIAEKKVLESVGHVTEATIINRYTKTHCGSGTRQNSGNCSNSYFAQYQFLDSVGQRYQGTTRVTGTYIDSVQTGHRINVVFNPASPTINQAQFRLPEIGRGQVLLKGIVIVSTSMCFGGLILMLLGWRSHHVTDSKHAQVKPTGSPLKARWKRYTRIEKSLIIGSALLILVVLYDLWFGFQHAAY